MTWQIFSWNWDPQGYIRSILSNTCFLIPSQSFSSLYSKTISTHKEKKLTLFAIESEFLCVIEQTVFLSFSMSKHKHSAVCHALWHLSLWGLWGGRVSTPGTWGEGDRGQGPAPAGDAQVLGDFFRCFDVARPLPWATTKGLHLATRWIHLGEFGKLLMLSCGQTNSVRTPARQGQGRQVGQPAAQVASRSGGAPPRCSTDLFSPKLQWELASLFFPLPDICNKIKRIKFPTQCGVWFLNEKVV